MLNSEPPMKGCYGGNHHFLREQDRYYPEKERDNGVSKSHTQWMNRINAQPTSLEMREVENSNWKS